MTTPSTPAGWYPDPDGSGGQRYWDGTVWTDQRAPAAPPPVEPPPPVAPPPVEPPSTASFEPPPAFDQAHGAPSDARTAALKLFAGITGALLVLLIAAVAYAVLVNETANVGTNAFGSTSDTSTEPTAETSESTETASPTSEPTETPVAADGDAVDGPLTFTVHGIEVGSTVVMSDAPVEKTANGEYNVVHMTVTNTGSEPTAFVASYQKLNANGEVYSIDDQATAYLEGTFADLQPGASADVSIAFDVPPGTEAESVELHADPTTPGVVVPFE
jgi:hypothetical protein